MFRTERVEKIKIHTSCSETLFRISCHLWEKVEKCGRRGQATWVCAVHTGYPWLLTHTQIWNNYCFSAATVVTRTPLAVTLVISLLPLPSAIYIPSRLAAHNVFPSAICSNHINHSNTLLKMRSSYALSTIQLSPPSCQTLPLNPNIAISTPFSHTVIVHPSV